MTEKAQENIAVLRQGAELLRSIDDATYRQSVEVVFGGTLGGHYRHALDHYVSFFDGLPSGRIDYEARTRDAMVETERQAAIELSATVCERLGQLAEADADRALLVREDGSGSEPCWALSSVARELEFLLSHTVHHQALASILCRLLGVEVDETFGVAPSTLRHRGDGFLCAR
jgi:uncharacterized damage-inducible protein DinB